MYFSVEQEKNISFDDDIITLVQHSKVDSYRYGADLVRLGQPRQQTEDEKGIVLLGLVYRIMPELANAMA